MSEGVGWDCVGGEERTDLGIVRLRRRWEGGRMVEELYI